MQESGARYANVSIAIHWITFALILVNGNIGGGMGHAIKAFRLEHLQLHKSVGITILLLSLVRLGWRLAHPWPPFADRSKAWERIVARGTHLLFYGLVIAVPLFGWAAASAGDMSGVRLLGAVPLPALPVPISHSLAETLGGIHKAMVNAIYLLLALHVVGAMKHHFLDRDEVLARMIPVLRRRDA